MKETYESKGAQTFFASPSFFLYPLSLNQDKIFQMSSLKHVLGPYDTCSNSYV